MLKKQPRSQLSAPNSKLTRKLFGVDSVTFGVFHIFGCILVLLRAQS